MMELLLLGVNFFAFSVLPPFRIQVVDGETGRGVPLVKLTTSSYISYFTDSSGIVAFDEPGMLGARVFFMVTSDGYVNARDLLGSPQPGVLLKTVPGGNATVIVNRTQPAERLYRLTGGGLYRDTLLTGGRAPVAEPLLSSASVLGQDSLMGLVFKGVSFWFFGDTECPAGPRNSDCQNYGKYTTGATAAVGADGDVPPSLSYFVSNNSRDPGGMGKGGLPNAALLAVWNPDSFAHPKPMLAGPGVVPNYKDNSWVGSATVVAGQADGEEERMYLTYVCPQTQLQGLAIWNEVAEHFVPVRSKQGYAMRYSGAQWVQLLKPGDHGYAYYASAFANVRVKSSFSAIEDPSQYEYFTPCNSTQRGGCNVSMDASSWGWRRGDLGDAAADDSWAKFGPLDEFRALQGGYLQLRDARMQVRDGATGRPLQPAPGGSGGGETLLARGSVNWNAHRSKYVLIADQSSPQRRSGSPAGKPSAYGELWYCESDAVTGPWGDCDRIITHNTTGASCYNPQELPWLQHRGGEAIYVACTWTSMASGGGSATDRACAWDEYGGQGCAVAVPRYEYNNVVFKVQTDRVQGYRAGFLAREEG